MEEFLDEYVRDDGDESRAVSNEQHPNISPSLVQMLQGCVQGDGNGLLCRPVLLIYKLVRVEPWREGGFDMPQYQSFQTFGDNGREGFGPVVVQVFQPIFLWDWYDCGYF